MNRRNLPFMLLLAILLLALGFLSGCEDDDPCLPLVPAGRITGHVSAGGVPSDLVVRAVPLADGLAGEALFETVVDFYGQYSLDLPEGSYHAKLSVGWGGQSYDYCGAEMGYGQREPAVLEVGNGTIIENVDFSLGSLRVQVGLSHELDGEIGEVELHLRDAVEVPTGPTYLHRAQGTITDGALDLTLLGVLPGEYQVEVILGRRIYACVCPYDGEHVWLPGQWGAGDSPWITCPADSLVSVSMELTSEPAFIEGRLGGAWQDLGWEPPEISIVTPDSVLVMGPRRAMGVDGEFSIPLHCGGEVKLVVSHEGVESWVGGDDFASASVFQVTPGQTIAGVEMESSAVQLTVADNGLFFWGSTVELYDPVSRRMVAVSEPWVFSQSTTRTLPGVKPGEYLMRIDSSYITRGMSSWRPQWYDRRSAMDGATVITVPEGGALLSLAVTLERGGALAGEVATDRPDEERAFYVVATTAHDRSDYWRDYLRPEEAVTHFQIWGLPDGDFKLGFFEAQGDWEPGDALPDRTQWYGGDSWIEAQVLTIEEAGTVDGLEIAFP